MTAESGKKRTKQSGSKKGGPGDTYRAGRKPSKEDRVLAGMLAGSRESKDMTIDLESLYDYAMDAILNEIVCAGALKKFGIVSVEDIKEDKIVRTLSGSSTEPIYPPQTLLALAILHLCGEDAVVVERFARIALHSGIRDAAVVLAFKYDLSSEINDPVRATDLLAPLAYDRPDVMFIMSVRKALGYGTERDTELADTLALLALRDRSSLAIEYPINMRDLDGRSFTVIRD